MNSKPFSDSAIGVNPLSKKKKPTSFKNLEILTTDDPNIQRKAKKAWSKFKDRYIGTSMLPDER